MPSLSPPPLKQRTSSRSSAAPPSTSVLSTSPTAIPPVTTKLTANAKPESDADVRLRDPYPPSSNQAAFGGKRRPNRDSGLGLRWREWAILGVVMVVGVGTRMYRLWWPTSVVYVSSSPFFLPSSFLLHPTPSLLLLKWVVY